MVSAHSFRVWSDNSLCFRLDEMVMKRIRFLVTNGHTDIMKLDDPVQHSIRRRAIRIARRLKAETRRRLHPFASDNPLTQLSLAALDVGIPA
jgi:hypothetical protein